MRTGLLTCLFLIGCDEAIDLEAGAAEASADQTAWTATTKLITANGASYSGTPFNTAAAGGEEGFWGAQYMGTVPGKAGASIWNVTQIKYVLIDDSQGFQNVWCDSSVTHRVRVFTSRDRASAIQPAERPTILKEWVVPAASTSTGPRFVTLTDRAGVPVKSGESLFVAIEMVADPGGNSGCMCIHTAFDADGIDATWFSSSTAAPYGWNFLADLGVTDVDYGFEVTLGR